jgi:FAD/FMN-containing dehydrogenase
VSGIVPGAEVHAVESEAELAELLREASRVGRDVRVWGGDGVPLTLPEPEAPGTLPPWFVSLERLAAIHEHEPADLTLTAGAGLGLETLSGHLRSAGQWLPVDAPGWQRRTLGGLVAGGRWGPLHLGYGAPRDHVLGATLVTGDGQVLELGGRVVKNVAGFDLLRPLVGSRGRLGVVTRATIRLYPIPAADRTLLFPGDSAVALHELGLSLAGLPGAPAALELFGGDVPGGWGEALPAGGAGALARGFVALRLTGSAGGVEALTRLATQRAGVDPHRVDGAEASGGLFDSLARGVEPGRPWIRLGILPSRLPELVVRIGAVLEGLGEGGWWGTHVRAGVLRIVPGRSQGIPPTFPALESLLSWVEGAGGSVRVGGGLPSGPGNRPPRLAALEAGIRRVFDPSGVLGALPERFP